MAPRKSPKPRKGLKKAKKLEATKPLTTNTTRFDPYKGYNF